MKRPIKKRRNVKQKIKTDIEPLLDQKLNEVNQLGPITHTSFTLREYDKTSPMVICEWIKLNIETAPASKLHDALESALRMRNRRRYAD